MLILSPWTVWFHTYMYVHIWQICCVVNIFTYTKSMLALAYLYVHCTCIYTHFSLHNYFLVCLNTLVRWRKLDMTKIHSLVPKFRPGSGHKKDMHVWAELSNNGGLQERVVCERVLVVDISTTSSEMQPLEMSYSVSKVFNTENWYLES